MEQKLYNYEIILNLLKGPNHLRRIAKELRINHMTIKRALDFMVKQNILDVREQGKNNIFSIKSSLEAQNSVLISEVYRLDKFVRRHYELKREIIELKKLPVNLIAIFGSYARGNETKESDIDIFIETSDKKIKDAASKLNSKFSIQIGKFNGSLLIKEIEKNHVLIKGFEEFYGKREIIKGSLQGQEP